MTTHAITGNTLNDVMCKFKNLVLSRPPTIQRPAFSFESDTANVCQEFNIPRPLSYKDFVSMPKQIDSFDWDGTEKGFYTNEIVKEELRELFQKYRFVRAQPIYIFSFSSPWTSAGLAGIYWFPHVENVRLILHGRVDMTIRAFFNIPETQKHSYRLGQNAVIAMPLPWLQDSAAFPTNGSYDDSIVFQAFPPVYIRQLRPFRFVASGPQTVGVTVWRAWYGVEAGALTGH